jgi:dsRNA-specific ribonuclease
MKDAAFGAYVALYRAGLLNDNLLPLTNERVVDEDVREEAPSTIDVQDQFNPWVDLAKTWASHDIYQTTIFIDQKGEDGYSMILTTPLAIPTLQPFALYWNSKTTFTVRTTPASHVPDISSESLQLMGEIMHTLLWSTHSDYKSDDRKDFALLFTPSIIEDQLGNWLAKNRGRRSAQEEFRLNHESSPNGLVRSSLYYGAPHIFCRWHTNPLDEADSEVECLPLPKRRNFLRRDRPPNNSIGSGDQETTESMRKSRMFPVSSCTIDLLPFEEARMSLFIPAITQHLEILLIASQLRQTVLKDVPLKGIGHVITAISASSAQWVTDYQRYEFLGDSVLKFIVSIQLFIEHENWHEGYLSENRDRLVSNSRLAKAAMEKGLDAFIVTRLSVGKHWTAPLISQVVAQPPGQRTVSSKVLADVVEALIGAAFLDGGFSVARTCIHTFLPSISITSPVFRCDARPSNASIINVSISKAELLVGYQFQDKTLFVEALTHPSCDSDTMTESYQRLEFLGDAVLDMVVVSTIFKHNQVYSHGDMTQMKAALVNADFLAFLCLELSIIEDTVNIQENNEGEFFTVPATEEIGFWMFMRHNSREITKAQQACLARHQQLRGEILACLKDGNSYPWVLLAQLNAEKFFSDIIESLFGAIFVDTNGSLADCELFAERIGIIAYLRRMLAGCIEVVHPKMLLGMSAGPDKVDYVVDAEDDAPGSYRCLVRVGDVDVATVGGCLSKNEAVVRAADAAVKVMSARKGSHEDIS